MTVTVDFLLVVLALGLMLIGGRTTYWIIKNLAGFVWWGLAFYWVQNPISADSNIQTIMVVVIIIVGVACQFWGMWHTRSENGVEVSGRIRLPFMRTDVQEEAYQLSKLDDRNSRNARYSQRVSNAINGRRNITRR